MAAQAIYLRGEVHSPCANIIAGAVLALSAPASCLRPPPLL